MRRITAELVSQVAAKAESSPRKRMHHNFHKAYEDKVQRLLNACMSGTYIRPHRHNNPDKDEVFIILRGRILIAEFDDSGRLKDHFIMDAQKGNLGVEIPAGVWHTFICLEDGSCVYEVKEGPYHSLTDKDFAPWAPKEESPEAGSFNRGILEKLGIGT